MKGKEKVKEACSECSDKKAQLERAVKVASILEGVKYKTETDKAEAILSFSRSPMTYEEIEKIMAPGKPDYMSGQVYRKGVF